MRRGSGHRNKLTFINSTEHRILSDSTKHNFRYFLSNLTQLEPDNNVLVRILPDGSWFLPALSQEVGEEWQGVVKLHLFVVESTDE